MDDKDLKEIENMYNNLTGISEEERERLYYRIQHLRYWYNVYKNDIDNKSSYDKLSDKFNN